ncbi:MULTISPECIES: hypothetical protein [Nocardia]|uniref:Secreted protein n=2 Tax=Nocardia TaxID=1817 RepID=A0A846W074_9NOCA|nr:MULTISPECIES: hypothetical protein [Nocardia]KAF0846999.1 hypothetical protein FNL39_104421 [Nocardia caishijiensis]NKX86186.1 hypothetical protein [Nocardia coubleae]
MSTRSIVTGSAAALLLGAVVAAPAQAFPAGWFDDQTYVCTATDRTTGAWLPEVVVEAPDQVGAGFYALPLLGPNADNLNLHCRPA